MILRQNTLLAKHLFCTNRLRATCSPFERELFGVEPKRPQIKFLRSHVGRMAFLRTTARAEKHSAI